MIIRAEAGSQRYSSRRRGRIECCNFGWINVRNFQAFLLACLVACIAMQSNIGLVVVVMVDVFANEEYSRFDWDLKQQMAAQTSFFLGFALMNFASGMFAQKVDNKILISVCFLFNTLGSFLTPTLLNCCGGWTAFMLIRFFIGACSGLIVPGIYGQLSRWCPFPERVRMNAFVWAGTFVGHATIILYAGRVQTQNIPWPNTFYIVGLCTTIACFFWILFGAYDPTTCFYISYDEEKLILSTLFDEENVQLVGEIAWRRIFRNKPFYALITVHFCHNVALSIILIQMPVYFKEVFKYTFYKAAIVTSSPFVIAYALSFPVTYVMELFINANIATTGFSQKFYTILANWGSACCFLALSITDELFVSITLYAILASLELYNFAGFHINHTNLAPNISALLLGMALGVSSIGSMVGPLMIAQIIDDISDRVAWIWIFFVLALVSFFGGLIFTLYGSAHVQDFADDDL